MAKENVSNDVSLSKPHSVEHAQKKSKRESCCLFGCDSSRAGSFEHIVPDSQVQEKGAASAYLLPRSAAFLYPRKKVSETVSERTDRRQDEWETRTSSFAAAGGGGGGDHTFCCCSEWNE